ncbi:MAG: M1 family metallopeptidase [Saprospiraceae bacterium]|nr:M1 family metallopeptidase [Saprospiraceae bacterium]
MKIHLLVCLLLLALFTACKQETPTPASPDPKADPHSFAQPNLAVAKHLDLSLKVDFDQKTLSGTAAWTIENPGKASEIIFDTDNLDIQKITLGKEAKEAKFHLVAPDSVLGSALRVAIEPTTDLVTIHYATRSDAAALGWMEPSMTVGKKLPFLFTQGQAILTRSWIPCQDSPGNRITYNANIEVPTGMMAVMSAENPQQISPDGKYSFKMDLPIAPYLIALAVGDIAFKPISGRTGVYAEPVMLEKVAWEFADMEKMVVAAESLYGPYAWGRFDVIVLPTGFPFGGMENPKLTFATPTVIAGDRSLVSLVAHELAHSWSGNLVTNATWADFWLNEGFTVYFERRIMEALYGWDFAEMQDELEYHELLAEMEDLDSSDTQLKIDLIGRSPDDGSSMVPYQKGSMFLRMLEQKTDRGKWDAFLKSWFETNKFTSKTTEDFLAFLQKNYLDKYQVTANVEEWVYKPGIPANCPVPQSGKLAAAKKAADNIANGFPDTNNWTPQEWVHFIRSLPENAEVATFKKLDEKFHLTQSTNAQIQLAWYEVSIRHGYVTEILPQVEDYLVKVGRRYLVLAVYRALKETGHVEDARRIFAKAKPGYHAVSWGSVEELLK